MTTIHSLNLLNDYFVLQLLKDGDYLSVFGQAQVNSLVSLFLDAHSIGFTILDCHGHRHFRNCLPPLAVKDFRPSQNLPL